MSNQLWINVEAANTYISIGKWEDEFSWLTLAKYLNTPWKPSIYNYASIGKVPLELIKEWKTELPKWKNFKPNY